MDHKLPRRPRTTRVRHTGRHPRAAQVISTEAAAVLRDSGITREVASELAKLRPAFRHLSGITS